MFANISPLTFSTPPLSGFISMEAFRFRHLSTDSTTTVWVVQHSILVVLLRFNLDVTSCAPLVRSACSSFLVSTHLHSVESAQVSIFLTSDFPRPRTDSVDCTHSPHVCYQPLTILLNDWQICDQDGTNFVTRVRNRYKRCCITDHLVAGGDFMGFEAAHMHPLGAADIVCHFTPI